MKTNLIITDPLAGQEVSIMMTVTAGEALSRDERPFLLSVGVAGQMPITRSGTFGTMQKLIDEAWTAFGVREQVTEQAVETATSAQLSTGVSQPIAEEIVAEAAVTPTNDAIPPKRPASKLSLF